MKNLIFIFSLAFLACNTSSVSPNNPLKAIEGDWRITRADGHAVRIEVFYRGTDEGWFHIQPDGELGKMWEWDRQGNKLWLVQEARDIEFYVIPKRDGESLDFEYFNLQDSLIREQSYVLSQ